MRTPRRILWGLAAAIPATVAALSAVPPAAFALPEDDLQAAKAATARYHSIGQAERDGYVLGSPCTSSPAGGMGFHYENHALMSDPAVDPTQPEILLYAPGPGGRLQLVGIEYWKADADQNPATSSDRPTLFGQPFNGPMPGHHPGMPVHYDLHVWLWQGNPAGMFAPFNPTVSC